MKFVVFGYTDSLRFIRLVYEGVPLAVERNPQAISMILQPDAQLVYIAHRLFHNPNTITYNRSWARPLRVLCMLNRLQFMFEQVLNLVRLQDGSLSGLGRFP